MTPPPDRAADLPRESTRTILFQFVVFPLGVVLVGVAIFLLFGAIASEEHTSREYVQDIRNGSRQRRWQAAYQLSQSLNRGEAKNDPNLQREIEELYGQSKSDDPQIRRYLSMVLGKLGSRTATPLLVEGLRDSDVQSRLYAMLALGEIKDARAVPHVAALAENPESDVRKTAVYVLGQLGDRRAVPLLTRALQDETPDVRWNAAVALSRFGQPAALPVLREMLDRPRLDAMAALREDQKENAMLVAMSAYHSLARSEAEPLLRQLASKDRSLRVRAAAIETLKSAGR